MEAKLHDIKKTEKQVSTKRYNIEKSQMKQLKQVWAKHGILQELDQNEFI